jgi:flagellar basal-body rod modification protein FlgD
MSYTISKDATFVPTPAGTATAGSTAADAKTLTGNYQTFLSLLTAQIKNQDPLSPMDTTQWTNQLVQYSSVEQQLKGNQFLEQMANNNTTQSMSSAVSFIGKTVTADVNTATLSNGSANWNYSLGADAASATLKVLDSSGNVVWTGTPPDMSKGVHTFNWDGKDINGKTVPNADYTLSVTAKTSGDIDIDTAVGITGTVTAADSSSGTIMLRLGDTEVPLSSVSGVANPS